MAEQRRNQQNQRQPQQSQSGSGQQGDQSNNRQQQQFDTSNRQQGGGGSAGSIADQIQPHQQVVDQSGVVVGTVDHVDGDRIKLTRTGSGDGQHHYIALNQVAGIEGGKIRLQGRGDASFGQQANT